MTALKMAVAAAALLALGGCIVVPYGGSGYYGGPGIYGGPSYYGGGPAYYGDSGYDDGVGVGVSVGGVDVGVSDRHDSGERGGDHERGDDGGRR